MLENNSSFLSSSWTKIIQQLFGEISPEKIVKLKCNEGLECNGFSMLVLFICLS